MCTFAAEKLIEMNALLIGILLPLAGTMLGAAFVFFLKKDIPDRLQKTLLGFASGVMVAASVWSLLLPSIEMATSSCSPELGGLSAGLRSVTPAVVGFLAGIAFLLLIDELTPHMHVGAQKSEGPRSRLSRTMMLALAVTIHNLPEGMAVGVVFAGEAHGLSLSAALAVSIGIALQNIPEGAIISMPMYAEGNSRLKSFLIGTLSGVVEPLGSVAILLLASTLGVALPYLLSFAAGAMMYVVVEELIPETAQGRHTNLSTIGFALGFVLMMVMDVVLS